MVHLRVRGQQINLKEQMFSGGQLPHLTPLRFTFHALRFTFYVLRFIPPNFIRKFPNFILTAIKKGCIVQV